MFVSTNVLGQVSYVREIKTMGNSKLFQFGVGVKRSVKMDKYPFAKPTGNGEWGYIYQNINVKIWGNVNDPSLDNLAKRMRKGANVVIKDADIAFDMRTGDPEMFQGADGVMRSKLDLVVPSVRNVDIIPSVSTTGTQAVPQAQQSPAKESKVEYDFDYDVDENDLF